MEFKRVKFLCCKRCTNEWQPKILKGLPKCCPRCKSPYWNKEYAVRGKSAWIEEKGGPQMLELEVQEVKKPSKVITLDRNRNEEFFEFIWKIYPRKEGKLKSKDLVLRALKKGYSFKDIQMAVEYYHYFAKEADPKYVMLGTTFFGGRWIDWVNGNPREQVEKSIDEIVEESNDAI